MKNKYLITGVAGFKVCNLAKALSMKNKITIIDNLNVGLEEYLLKNKI